MREAAGDHVTAEQRRSMKARRAGPCPRCGGWIYIGARVIRIDGRWLCAGCALLLARSTADRKAALAGGDDDGQMHD